MDLEAVREPPFFDIWLSKINQNRNIFFEIPSSRTASQCMTLSAEETEIVNNMMKLYYGRKRNSFSISNSSKKNVKSKGVVAQCAA